MKHRISVGAIIINHDKILMVNHKREDRYDFWVAPGGGIKGIESMEDAVKREVKEETGFDASVGNLLYIEDMYEPEQRLMKFWYLCNIEGGSLECSSPDALAEYIVDAKFMSQAELANNIVFPYVLSENPDGFWQKVKEDNPQVEYLPLREMEFV